MLCDFAGIARSSYYKWLNRKETQRDKENKEKLYINPKRCKGCGYCINACPQDALSVSDFVNEKGYNTVQVDETKCVACGMCYRVCPDYVFEIR